MDIWSRKIATRVAGKSTIALLLVSTCAALGMTVAEIALAKALQLVLHGFDASEAVNPSLELFGRSLEITFESCIAGILIFGLSRAAFQFVIGWTSGISENLILARLRQIAVADLMLTGKIGLPSTGQILHQMENVFPRAAAFFFYVSLVIPQTFLIFGLVVGLAYVNLGMCLFAVMVIGVLGVVTRKLSMVVHERTTQQLKPQAEFVTRLARVTRNWLFIRAIRTQQAEYERLTHHNLHATSNAISAKFNFIVMASFPNAGGIVLLCFLMTMQRQFGMTDSASFFQFVYLLIRLVQVLAQMAGNVGSLSINWSGVEQAFAVVKHVDSQLVYRVVSPLSRVRFGRSHERNFGQNPVARKASAPYRPISSPRLAVANMTFGFEDSPPIFEDLTFTIEPGEQIGFTGSSGTGKSTLLALMLGILRPSQGGVAIDGLDPEAYFSGISHAVGYVGAEAFLIEGTIQENLDYGSDWTYSQQDYLEAIAKASLSDLLTRLPGGLAHQLGEGGEGLSTGEKQRLALARALLRQPKLLVLDELTANLDTETERDITEMLLSLKGRCTCLIVSHRALLLRYSDRVLDLETGSWSRPEMRRQSGEAV